MNSSESAELIVKAMIEGTEMLLRLTGTGVERAVVLLYTMNKDKQMSKGKTNLNNMLKSGSPLKIFSLKENELAKFNESAKNYGVLYSALVDRKHPDPDGMVDIMVKMEDAEKVNRIVDRFKLSAYDTAMITSEIEKDRIKQVEKEAKEKGIEVKSDIEKLAEEILSKPIQKEENDSLNPQQATTEKIAPLSEPSYENKNNSGVASNNRKPSVRETLRKIKEERKNDREREKDKDLVKKPNKVKTERKIKNDR